MDQVQGQRQGQFLCEGRQAVELLGRVVIAGTGQGLFRADGDRSGRGS